MKTINTSNTTKQKNINFVITFLLFYSFLIFIFAPTLKTYVLSGDDLFSISNAYVTYEQVVAQFTVFSGAFRPLGHIVFNIYKLFLPHFTTIFLINLSLVALVQTLLFNFLRKIVPQWISAAIACIVFLSPIFYYHIFTISGTNNILMLVAHLLLLQLVRVEYEKHRPIKIIWGLMIFIISIFIKETFLLNGLILSLIAYQNSERKKTFYMWLVAVIGITGLYIVFRMGQYIVTDVNYSFVYTPSKLLENLASIASWMLNYPRGWQYGAPLPKTISTFLIAGLTCLIAGLTLSILMIKKTKLGLFLGMAFILSLAPYLFLNRILIYYLDGAIIVFFISIAFALNNFPKKKQLFLIALLISICMSHFFIIYPQWHKYSFVANANETAKNYIYTLSKSNVLEYDAICILNHNKGAWATENGNLANFLYSKKFKIISTLDTKKPKECGKESLVLINDERSYLLYDRFKY